MKVDGVIVKIAHYKDSNAIITLLTKNEILTFQAHNVYKMFSKFSLLANPLLYGQFTFSDNKEYLAVKEVYSIFDPRNFIGNASIMFCLNSIQEITYHLFIDEDMIKIYDYLITILKLLNDSNNQIIDNIFTYLLIYLATSLRLLGFGLNVDECVLTHTKNDIVGVSFIDGGLISKNVFDFSKHIKYSKEKISILRASFKVEAEDIHKCKFPKDLTKEIIKDLINYIKDQTNVSIKSIEIIDYFS